MDSRQRGKWGREAFTLIELLVVIGIVAILAAILLPLLGRSKQQADVVKTLSNMKQMGVAMFAYAFDNDNLLPNRAANTAPGATAADRWPKLLQPYLQDLRVYTSPIPPLNGTSYASSDPNKVLDNGANNTSYIYNGMNDRGALDDSSVTVRLNTIEQPVMTILLGIPQPKKGHFYMDLKEGDNNTVLNTTAFPSGSVYMFCDGSSRLLAKTKDAAADLQKPINSGVYTDWLWLIDKSQGSIIQQGH